MTTCLAGLYCIVETCSNRLNEGMDQTKMCIKAYITDMKQLSKWTIFLSLSRHSWYGFRRFVKASCLQTANIFVNEKKNTKKNKKRNSLK